MAASDEEILIPIKVKISKANSPGDLIISAGARAGGMSDITKKAFALVAIENRPLLLVGGHIEIKPPIVIIVAAFHAHGAKANPVAVVGQAQRNSHFSKVPVTIVVPDKIGDAVVAH